jgi:protein-S-isoprenylcysteine O-methyltransferase Ste14
VGLLAWPVQLGALHGAVPVELSRHGRRHGWRSDGTRPGVTNLAGLVPLGAGAAMISWALATHYAAAPRRRWRIRRSLEPEYLLTDGPYRLSRNPMHVGGIAIWGGWAVWFGSARVAAGLCVLTCLYRVAIAWEEQMLERRWGDEWQEYTRRTGRWLSLATARA